MLRKPKSECLDLIAWEEAKGRAYWLDAAPIGPTVVNERSGSRLDLMYRGDFLQIERAWLHPWEIVPLHRHPDVNSAELSIWGKGAFWIRRRKFVLDETCTRWHPFFIPSTCWHGGEADKSGGGFLSIQQWIVGVGQRSIEDNWESRETINASLPG